ncbi:YlcG family protein [Erwinia sp. JH02]|nr:YlcG family protein [Erwinia sp. JH02]
MTNSLRRRWQLLRMFRSKSSFMYDYRILQNPSHILRRAA